MILSVKIRWLGECLGMGSLALPRFYEITRGLDADAAGALRVWDWCAAIFPLAGMRCS